MVTLSLKCCAPSFYPDRPSDTPCDERTNVVEDLGRAGLEARGTRRVVRIDGRAPRCLSSLLEGFAVVGGGPPRLRRVLLCGARRDGVRRT